MARYKITTPPDNFPEDKDSSLSLYKKEGDKNLFNLIDSEGIRLSGSRILIYKYLPLEDFDEVYMESRQKIISPTSTRVWGHFDPRPIEENLTQFGVEVQNDQLFLFNKSYLENVLGRPVIAGDVLKPEFQNIKYQVHEVQEDSFEAYGVYHIMAHAKVLRDTKEIHNEEFLDTTDNLGGRY